MKIKEFIKNSPTIIVFCSYWINRYPVFSTKLFYWRKLGKKLNLKNPRDLNEKIQWLKLYSDTSMWPLLADKYRVREYVKQCGLSEMLNELYGVWESPDDINFKNIPNQFVLKTNNGSGDVIVVKDKSKIDEEIIRKDLRQYLNRHYGVTSVEPHYLKIKPCIICEKLLQENSNISSSLIDYKFYCSLGNVLCLMVCFDREIGVHAEKVIYDIQSWTPHLEYLTPKCQSTNSGKIIPRPKSLPQMIEAAKVLSKEFPLVRVDFYEINEKPIFGELTFTSDAGCISYLTDKFLLKIGQMVKLPNLKTEV